MLRKALHLPGLALPWLGARYPGFVWWALSCASFAYLAYEIFRQKFSDRWPAWTKQLQRGTEIDFAPIYLALGLAWATTRYPWRASWAAAILICFCDGLAALSGMRWGRKKIFSLPKTYVGSGVFFVSATLCLVFLFDWPQALLIAAFVTVIEMLSLKGTDNLAVPVLGGALATWLLL